MKVLTAAIYYWLTGGQFLHCEDIGVALHIPDVKASRFCRNLNKINKDSKIKEKNGA
jgi:hypothetical protein